MRRRLPLLLLALPLVAGGQEGKVGAPFWISTPPAARAALDSAVASAAAGDWLNVARAVQAVFDRHAQHFVPTAGSGAYVGARQRAMEFLLGLPAEARREYERTYGPAAAEDLAAALASGDEAALFGTVRRFECTAAGRLALFALADRALDRGRRGEARLLLRRIERQPPAEGESPGIAARRAALEERAGDADPAASEGWPMLGGAPSRNRIAPEVHWKPERYQIPFVVPERQNDRPQTPTQRYFQQRTYGFGTEFELRWGRHAPVHPVLARGRLVFHDGRQVRAHNAFTGEELWRHPRKSSAPLDGRTNFSSLYSPLVDDGVVYASIETESEFAPQMLQNIPITYYLPMRRLVAIELETGRVLWSHESIASVAGGEAIRRTSVTGVPVARGDRIYAAACSSEGVFHSFLVAVDKATGAVQWSTRVSNGQQELNLFGRQLQESVPTPVAAADGLLYYGTNLGVVAALDELLGTPVWATTYDVRPIPATFLWYEAPRRWPLADNGPPLVAGDLLLVAPTDGDSLLALDRMSGRIRWTRRYPGTDPQDPRLFRLLAADGRRAYVTRDGVEAVWLRDDASEAARGGELAWQATELPEGELPSGRGLLAEDGLWVPTFHSLFRFDPVSGKIAAEEAREGRDGGSWLHLVAGEGILLGAGRSLSGDDFIGARYDRDEVVDRARRRLARSPDDLPTLLAAADTFLAVREPGEATKAFLRARKEAARAGLHGLEERAAMGLFRSMLLRAEETLEKSPAEAGAGFEAAFAAAPDAGAREAARRRYEDLLAAREAAEDLPARLRNLEALARDHGDSPVGERGGSLRIWALRRIAGLLAGSGELAGALDAWHRLLAAGPGALEAAEAVRAVGAILETEPGRLAYAPFEARAAGLFRASFLAGDLAAVEKGLSLYPNARATAQAILEYARIRLSRGEPGPAVVPLQDYLAGHGESAEAPLALHLLFQALHARGAYGSALGALRQIRKRHPDARLARPDGTEAGAAEIVDAWLGAEPYSSLAQSARRRDLDPPLVHRFDFRGDPDASLDLPEMVGARPVQLDDTIHLRMGNSIYCLRGGDGTTLYRIELLGQDPRGPLVLADGRLLVLTRRYVHHFDALSGKPLFRRVVPDGEEGRRLLFRNGRLFLLSQGGTRSVAGAVSEIDPASGEVVWRCSLPDEESEEMMREEATGFSGEEIAIFTENPVRMTLVDSTSGKVSDRVLLAEGRGSALVMIPLFLPDGRILLPLTSHERTGPHQYEYRWELVLVDPSRRGDEAIVWRLRRPDESGSRYIQTLHVDGTWLAVLDDQRGALVVDLSTGRIAKSVPRLPVTDAFADQPYLANDRPEHESLLLLLTRSKHGADGVPAHLAGFDLPDLGQRYAVPVGAGGGDLVHVIDSQGVLAFAVVPGDRGISEPAVRLLDPLTGRLLQEIPPDDSEGWFTAAVQNGHLVIFSAGNVARVYGPK